MIFTKLTGWKKRKLAMIAIGKLLLISATASAQNNDPASTQPASVSNEVDYGQLYVLQKRDTVRPWELSLNYSYSFSNPHLSTHGIALGFQRQLGNFVLIGITPTLFANSSTDLGLELENRLGAQGIQELVDRPRFSIDGGIGLIPFSGMLNWFNSAAVNFDIVIGLRGGMIRYSVEDHMIPTVKTSVSPRFMISDRFGVMAALNVSFDRFDEPKWIHRVDTSVGTIFRF